jgi:hypothetical protein
LYVPIFSFGSTGGTAGFRMLQAPTGLRRQRSKTSTNSSTFAESDGKSYDIIRRQRSSNGVLSKYINFSFDIVFASIILPKFKNDVSPIDPRCCAIVVFQSEPAVPTRY